MKIEKIEHDGQVLAIITRAGQADHGVHFATANDNALQVGWQRRAAGVRIAAHAHCAVDMKEGHGFMQEVLYIERGSIKVIFYADDGGRVTDRVLGTGDTILLIRGGHGFEVLEDTQMLEVKMGPYDPASKKNINVKEIPRPDANCRDSG